MRRGPSRDRLRHGRQKAYSFASGRLGGSNSRRHWSTAAELRDMPIRQTRSVGTVELERIVSELQGEACLAFEDVEPQRNRMALTRSAGTPMTDIDTLF